MLERAKTILPSETILGERILDGVHWGFDPIPFPFSHLLARLILKMYVYVRYGTMQRRDTVTKNRVHITYVRVYVQGGSSKVAAP